MQKADGTRVTLKFDSSFKVTATEDGFGSGPGRPRRPAARPPSGIRADRHRAHGRLIDAGPGRDRRPGLGPAYA